MAFAASPFTVGLIVLVIGVAVVLPEVFLAYDAYNNYRPPSARR
ncbi:MAG: hypothetical protein QXX81_07865 [Zestosphaera sp.]